MKSLVLLAALFTGCSVGVTHQTEDEDHTEKSSAVERSRTTVAVGLLNEPMPLHDPDAPNANETPSNERSQTIVKVIVPEPSPKVIMTPLPPAPRHSDRVIQIKGSGNTVVSGDVHIYHHKHFHVYERPKPHPVRVDVRFELGDRIGERERRRRMVEKRIARFFPHYRD